MQKEKTFGELSHFHLHCTKINHDMIWLIRASNTESKIKSAFKSNTCFKPSPSSATPSGVASTFTHFPRKCQNGGVAHLDVYPTSILPNLATSRCRHLYLFHICHFEGKSISFLPKPYYGSFFVPQTSVDQPSSTTTPLPSFPRGTNNRPLNPHKPHYMGYLRHSSAFASYTLFVSLIMLYARSAACIRCGPYISN